jgi:benzoate membrane transport protein
VWRPRIRCWPTPDPDRALVTRVGYGAGEQVADGEWEAARELPRPREKRSRALVPQQRLAALLSGRDVALACEELTLRARGDLEAGRQREAAMQLHIALEAAVAELESWRGRGDMGRPDRRAGRPARGCRRSRERRDPGRPGAGRRRGGGRGAHPPRGRAAGPRRARGLAGALVALRRAGLHDGDDGDGGPVLGVALGELVDVLRDGGGEVGGLLGCGLGSSGSSLYDGCRTLALSSMNVVQETDHIAQPARSEIELAAVLHALSDPVRLRIVAALAVAGEEPSCGSFDLPVTKSTCTHHFKVLREAGVIQQRQRGTARLNALRRGDLDARFPACSTPCCALPERTAHLVVAGIVAAVVGWGGAFAIVITGLTAVGATDAQAASGLLALSIGMGVLTIWIAARTRIPVTIAWSTPGAALLASAGAVEGGWPAAVGAFAVCGALLALAGLWRPLGRLIGRIPAQLANAMLAGVLLSVCLAPVRFAAESPLTAAPILITWVVLLRVARRWATPGAIVGRRDRGRRRSLRRRLRRRPAADARVDDAVFEPGALIGLALPLFIVTMASQNVTGMTVLGTYGYRPSLPPVLAGTGTATVMAAPFGGHGLNLAAISAALTGRALTAAATPRAAGWRRPPTAPR